MPTFLPAVELASGLDALYLSAQGTAPPPLFADPVPPLATGSVPETPVVNDTPVRPDPLPLNVVPVIVVPLMVPAATTLPG